MSAGQIVYKHVLMGFHLDTCTLSLPLTLSFLSLPRLSSTAAVPTPARSIAQDTVSDKAVGRLRGVRIQTKVFMVFFILAATLAVILDSGDRIETPTSGMVLPPLITVNPCKDVLGDSLAHLDLQFNMYRPFWRRSGDRNETL